MSDEIIVSPNEAKSILTDRRGLLKGAGTAAIGISLLGLTGCGGNKSVPGGPEDAVVNFYNWDTYIAKTTLADYDKAKGVKVKMTNFANNDELFAKFKAGNPGYDVIVPSNDFVERMVKANMLEPLDMAKIPNFKNIDEAYRDVPFDPGRKFSMPYTWLVLGIGYRKSKVKVVPDSWKVLLDSDEYKGRIALLSEAGDLFRLYAKYLGNSVNEITPEMIKQIEVMLKKQKANVKSFHSDDGQDLLESGEVDLVMEYNGDIAQKIATNPDIGFVIPKEGSQLNADNLCIPKKAPHPNNAHAFINYLLDAEVNRKILEEIQYPTPNAAAKALMPDVYKNNPVIFPSAEVLAKCEYASFNETIQPLFEQSMTSIMA
jgi:spermidine/putrescine transport system substrate-binding protein